MRVGIYLLYFQFVHTVSMKAFKIKKEVNNLFFYFYAKVSVQYYGSIKIPKFRGWYVNTTNKIPCTITSVFSVI